MTVVVCRVDAADCDAVSAVLTEAFAEDPALPWVYNTAEQYRRLAPAYFRWVTQRALTLGGVYLVDGQGAVLGLPSSALDTRPEQVQAAYRQLRALWGYHAAARLPSDSEDVDGTAWGLTLRLTDAPAVLGLNRRPSERCRHARRLADDIAVVGGIDICQNDAQPMRGNGETRPGAGRGVRDDA